MLWLHTFAPRICEHEQRQERSGYYQTSGDAPTSHRTRNLDAATGDLYNPVYFHDENDNVMGSFDNDICISTLSSEVAMVRAHEPNHVTEANTKKSEFQSDTFEVETIEDRPSEETDVEKYERETECDENETPLIADQNKAFEVDRSQPDRTIKTLERQMQRVVSGISLSPTTVPLPNSPSLVNPALSMPWSQAWVVHALMKRVTSLLSTKMMTASCALLTSKASNIFWDDNGKQWVDDQFGPDLDGRFEWVSKRQGLGTHQMPRIELRNALRNEPVEEEEEGAGKDKDVDEIKGGVEYDYAECDVNTPRPCDIYIYKDTRNNNDAAIVDQFEVKYSGQKKKFCFYDDGVMVCWDKNACVWKEQENIPAQFEYVRKGEGDSEGY